MGGSDPVSKLTRLCQNPSFHILATVHFQPWTVYIAILEIAPCAQHYHFVPERSALDTDIRSKLNYGIFTLNGTFSTHRCAQT